MNPDILIFGGGAAGLWILGTLRRAGYQTLLLEKEALGSGQTIQSQGIIHGGGKYAIRGWGDLASVRGHGQMPERWREHLAGRKQPDLSGVSVLSDQCLMWSPGLSLRDRAEGFLFPLLRMTGLLNVPPRPLDPQQWPKILAGSAGRVETMAEPVLASHTLVESLAGPYPDFIRLYDPGPNGSRLKFSQPASKENGTCPSVTVSPGNGAREAVFNPRLIILAAGQGNADILARAGVKQTLMQERPLSMILLRGCLDPLFGHCVARGRTQLTVTTPLRSSIIDSAAGGQGLGMESSMDAQKTNLWQIGGEIAERFAHEKNGENILKGARLGLRRWLPGLDLSKCELSFYRAVRAEPRRTDGRKPASFFVGEETSGLMSVWPTKLALVPLLADSVLAEVKKRLPEPAPGKLSGEFFHWPQPGVAAYPWQEAQWHPAS